VSLVLQSFVSGDIYIVKKLLTVWKLIGRKYCEEDHCYLPYENCAMIGKSYRKLY